MDQKISPEKLVFLAITSGMGFTKIAEMLSWRNITFPSSTSFYNEQRQIYCTLSDLAHDCCEIALHSCLDHKGISFDGSWDYRRNDKNCIVVTK